MKQLKAKLNLYGKEYTVDTIATLPDDKFKADYMNYLQTEQSLLDRSYHVLTNVEAWAKERGIAGGNGIGQLYKLAEELGEVASAVAKNNRATLIDGIGDMLVVLTVWSLQTSRLVYYDRRWTYAYRGIAGQYISPHEAFTALFEAVNTVMVNGRNSTVAQVKAVNESLMMLAGCYELALVECLEAAYEEIKSRKGKTVNGIFIKEG